jgi:hypothetical protein
MGDEGEFWRDVKAAKREERALLGVECQPCLKASPRGCASILLPQQRCRVCGNRDQRPRDFPQPDPSLRKHA